MAGEIMRIFPMLKVSNFAGTQFCNLQIYVFCWCLRLEPFSSRVIFLHSIIFSRYISLLHFTHTVKVMPL